MLTVQDIKGYIDNDAVSTKKQLAKVGQRYYDAEHDIKDYKIFYVDANGEIQEEKIKSNIKISHPFFTEIVDQEVQHILSGKDGFIKSDTPELQEKLDEYFNENEDFTAELSEMLTGVIAKGFDYMYAYKNEEGRMAFQAADSIGVVEVKAKETDDHCEYVISWYVDSIGKDNKQIKRIEVWDKDQTHFYVQEDDGEIQLDSSVEMNPRPHTLYRKDKDEKIYYKGFGFIPFFRMDNNKKQVSGLKPIKDLIDDYDILNCGLSNNIQDTNEAIYVVKGFDGENLDELVTNLRNKKHVGVGENGEVDIKTIDIPVEARKVKLEINEKNIYRFGMALNTSGLKDTNATTNLAIQAAYTLLDMKCNKLEIRLKQFLRKLLKVVLAEINEADGTDYQQKDVYFCFERETPTNAHENAQIELTEAQKQQTVINTLLNLAAHLDNETLMELIFEQLDLNYEDYKDKLPKPEDNPTYTAQNALNGIIPDDDGGGVIE